MLLFICTSKPAWFVQLLSDIVDKARKSNISISQEKLKSLVSASLGSGRIRLHPESLEDISEAQEMFASISPDTIMQQQNTGIR
jgi:hypothetical protein